MTGPAEVAWAAWEWAPAFPALVSATALVMTCINLSVCRRAAPLEDAGPADPGAGPEVSVCIPARNEERNIGDAVDAARASRGIAVEVLVYDDQSTDGTAGILATCVAADRRVRSVPTEPLPPGWNGKQWGCDRMGRAAQGRWLLFTDADVRLAPDCLARAVAEAGRLDAALLSTVPRQVTGSFLERLVVPLIHWMLFSWLPMPRMRNTTDPATSAGCGQFLLVRRDAWAASGGHAAFRSSMHDGIHLPRSLRRAGYRTDLYDGTDSVSCRMYRDAAGTWRGFAKNAYEGLGSPMVLAVFTVLEGLGILLPWAWLAVMALHGTLPPVPTALAAAACGMQLLQRLLLAIRFRQPPECVLLHPVSIAVLLAIQWRSWWLHVTGRRAWRGRAAG